MRDMMPDEVQVEKVDGSCSSWMKAVVDGNSILMERTSFSIEEGDIVVRRLPFGDERYEVDEAVFRQGPHGRELDHWELLVSKETKRPKSKPLRDPAVAVKGHNNTVVVDSNNTSISVQGDLMVAFDELERELSQLPKAAEREDAGVLLDLVRDYAQTKNARKGVIEKLLDVLPDCGKIASIGGKILDKFGG